MNNNDDDDDDPQNISPPVSPLRRTMLSDNEEQMNAKRFMDKFKNDRSSQLLESKFKKEKCFFFIELFVFKIGKIFMNQVFIPYNLMMIMMN
jgi:hypothetical protein